MAQATAISFAKFRILLGDGGSPEVFTAPCGFNSRSWDRTKNLNEVDVPDCADEDKPADVGREVRSLDWTVSGEGLLVEESVATWEAFFASNLSRNVQLELQFPGGVGTLRKRGKAHLGKFTITGNRGDKVTAAIELSADGALTAV